MTELLGARNPQVKRLRALLRDPDARAADGALVIEGPRVLDAAIERGAQIPAVYLGPSAERAFAPLVERARAAGASVSELREGVLEKVGDTRTPQPVLAVARSPVTTFDGAAVDGVVIVAVDVSDPGNLGTIIRSAEAAGAAGVIVCGNSVDPLNPKVVRSSAGAIFGTKVMESDDPISVLDALGARGFRRVGATAESGDAYDSIELGGRCALVLGNEAHGLSDEVRSRVDSLARIPMSGRADSLNVAMAATVLVFEAARQLRLAEARR